ncbi:hypothetical protein SAMN04489806_2186 [Paramicrobacterium humi]|uniref:Type II toxin-antitoxin system RelE/ParE family toxin n=1 Tax=Paramicrobacterium humi TaxID=640635 RepID=A0A1H4NH69_9MICO|nr:hypothetical protein SAMN04489806_2186 [Microbacterium humi]
MSPKPRFRPGVADDINALPTENLRRRALVIALDVANGRLRGLPLGNHRATGDLTDCFKVYFDVRDGPPRYRLVYRVLESGGIEVSLVEVVAVGRRASMAVYAEAARRLGRLDE